MAPIKTLLFSTLLTLTLAADCVTNKHGTYTYTVSPPPLTSPPHLLPSIILLSYKHPPPRQITAPQPIPDISGVCGGLWDNLGGWSQCSASESSCGVVGQYNDLQWKFTVPSICNHGMVESAWWEATENAYGDLQCE
ncbi:hypothetical protein CLAFUW4_09743 [Fulvia fulva]|uniref:Uncharacterized protein n=1 Tax=Passalora fulva TaxID=5499 RepID=A0A9Q8PIN4_PASFU|nr:uncharacterized protein CLAFUR5_12495 [Fulvia fulva]KAK4616189.1 hypothetical protein CLAFUR4_09748 [Fulvia fulva]KAK4617015.1 hypothetical protein CLAFUR0_09740 [Fulvia fulva]UJO23256.1 hypothetical protein CLAFUR5_12495 [Fulvia fulva]WPV19720.1 hypothetical protein CLAFUW4_09743 [Fulvia fulva]WPV34708.1 hypothetical protein CLAFUW7_09745 [Fulvia fulva]